MYPLNSCGLIYYGLTIDKKRINAYIFLTHVIYMILFAQYMHQRHQKKLVEKISQKC